MPLAHRTAGIAAVNKPSIRGDTWTEPGVPLSDVIRYFTVTVPRLPPHGFERESSQLALRRPPGRRYPNWSE